MNRLLNKNLNLTVIIAAIINIIVVFIFKIPCPWKYNFNIDCAGCGGTRMMQSLIKLDFYQAFRFNPFLFCLSVIGFIYGIYVISCIINKKKYYKIKDKDLWILLVLVILFTIIRNIPFFSYLKPTVVR